MGRGQKIGACQTENQGRARRRVLFHFLEEADELIAFDVGVLGKLKQGVDNTGHARLVVFGQEIDEVEHGVGVVKMDEGEAQGFGGIELPLLGRKFFERKGFGDFRAVEIPADLLHGFKTLLEGRKTVGRCLEEVFVSIGGLFRVLEDVFVTIGQRRINFCNAELVADLRDGVLKTSRPRFDGGRTVVGGILKDGEKTVTWRQGKELGMDGDEILNVERGSLAEKESEITLEKPLFLVRGDDAFEHDLIEFAHKRGQTVRRASRFHALKQRDGLGGVEGVGQFAQVVDDTVAHIGKLKKGFVGPHEFVVIVAKRQPEFLTCRFEFLANLGIFFPCGFERGVNKGAIVFLERDGNVVAHLDRFAVCVVRLNRFFSIFQGQGVSGECAQDAGHSQPYIGQILARQRFVFEIFKPLAELVVRVEL